MDKDVFLGDEIIEAANSFIRETMKNYNNNKLEDEGPIDSISLEIIWIAGYGHTSIILDIGGAKYEKDLIAAPDV